MQANISCIAMIQHTLFYGITLDQERWVVGSIPLDLLNHHLSVLLDFVLIAISRSLMQCIVQ